MINATTKPEDQEVLQELSLLIGRANESLRGFLSSSSLEPLFSMWTYIAEFEISLGLDPLSC